MSEQFDFCILGAGLAGISMADALSSHDLKCCVIDKSTIAAGASGTPAGLVNPATGRRATKSWKAELCYQTIEQNLAKITPSAVKNFFVKNGLLRPALFKKMASKMHEQFEQTSWPEKWCYWKTEHEIKEMHPGISCVEGGLWLPIGITVNIGAYLQAYAQFLESKGVVFFLNENPIVRNEQAHWAIHLDNQTLSTQNVLFAVGASTKASYWWDWLPMENIKGQVARFVLPSDAQKFTHSISSLGYMAQFGGDRSFVQGSTYEHVFDNAEPDTEGKEYLLKRMKKTLPSLAGKVSIAEQWAGIRATTPDRKPILGKHPVHPALHLFTGLGSKGLLYGKFLADHYADHLFKNKKLYPEVDINRFVR